MKSVHLGALYGTSIWQVGDSAEQNGSFKIAIVRGRNEFTAEEGRDLTHLQHH